MNGRAYSGRYDAIVVGVGAMGSATAYYLARRRKRVLGLERFGIPHNMGSSHGHTRIIRLAYYEHPLADLADKGLTRHDISLFGLDRLTKRGAETAPVLRERDGRPRSFPRVREVRPFW